MEEVVPQKPFDLSISVVSHLQIGLVVQLLEDLETYCLDSSLELLLTLNLDEALPFELNRFSFPIRLIRNLAPKGFGANHNHAFAHASAVTFCVMNPDIRLHSNPFHALLSCLGDKAAGVVAPLVLGVDGAVEDSARRFPTPLTILCKAMGRCKDNDYAIGQDAFHPDWVGGMCMVFKRDVFARLGGFDEGYFLYYEDVDICARLRLLGYEVVLNPQAKLIHHAQRTSRRSFTFLRWHFKSMMRFFLSPACWHVRQMKRSERP